MPNFSVVLLTAPPAGLSHESNGAFVKIDGREALLRSAELFVNRENVKQVLMVVSPDQAEEAKRRYGAHLGFTGVKLLVGGVKWSEQLKTAVESLDADATHVIVHDAARPAVPYNDLDELFAQAEKSTAVTLVTGLRAPLLELDEADQPVAMHHPSSYVQMQTPYAMTKAKFLDTAKAGKELHASEWKLIKGSPLNVRCGGASDERLIKAILTMLPKPKMRAPDNPFSEAQW